MPATNFAIQQSLKKMFHLTNYNLNTNYLFIGLSTSIIDDDGLTATEPFALSYKRVPINRNSTDWKLVDNILMGNNTPIVFPFATENWGRIKEIFISTDDGTNDNPENNDKHILFHTKLEEEILILAGTKLTLPTESIWAKGGNE